MTFQPVLVFCARPKPTVISTISRATISIPTNNKRVAFEYQSSLTYQLPGILTYAGSGCVQTHSLGTNCKFKPGGGGRKKSRGRRRRRKREEQSGGGRRKAKGGGKSWKKPHAWRREMEKPNVLRGGRKKREELEKASAWRRELENYSLTTTGRDDFYLVGLSGQFPLDWVDRMTSNCLGCLYHFHPIG